MEVYFENGQLHYRPVTTLSQRHGSRGVLAPTPTTVTTTHANKQQQSPRKKTSHMTLDNHNNDTRIRYHEKYTFCCIRMTKWQWTTLLALVVVWTCTIGYMYIHHYHLGQTHADRHDMMMRAAESNNIPGVPGWFAAIFLQYSSRQIGVDVNSNTNASSFYSWYNNIVDRTVDRYKSLYDDYNVRHPHENLKGVPVN